MKTVCIESPMAGDFERNIRFARQCLMFCLSRGVSPYASHLLIPQVSDDLDEDQRAHGIRVGLVMGDRCDERWFFDNYGWTSGMIAAQHHALDRAQSTRVFTLPSEWTTRRPNPTPGF